MAYRADEQIEQEKKWEEKRRSDFIEKAKEAGFSEAQATFMYDFLAMKNHDHGDGRLGGS